MSWFTRYQTKNPTTTWGKVQDPFVSRFNDVCNKKQAILALREVKQWKHENIEDYYDIFLQLCAMIPQQAHDVYLR